MKTKDIRRVERKADDIENFLRPKLERGKKSGAGFAISIGIVTGITFGVLAINGLNNFYSKYEFYLRSPIVIQAPYVLNTRVKPTPQPKKQKVAPAVKKVMIEPSEAAVDTSDWVEASKPYQARIIEAARTSAVPVQLVYRVLRKESMNFNPSVIACELDSPAGARGMGQFMPATAAGMGIDPCNPDEAIPASARYLSGKYKEHGTWQLALAAYNAGSGNVRKYGGIPPFNETQNYVASITEGLEL